jgi:hypothetical protein
MSIRAFVETCSFDREAINAMSAALECALAELKLVNRNNPVASVVARRIVTFAQQGERNATKLCELALKSIRE